MTTEQVLLRLPDDLVRRFKRAVPTRERSAFVRQLLESALPPEDGDHDPLYLAALAVERDTALTEEMGVWETATLTDGLTVEDTPARPK
jgi:metal-responsive CopG/Arc/MetJ family transcriptional regulator